MLLEWSTNREHREQSSRLYNYVRRRYPRNLVPRGVTNISHVTNATTSQDTSFEYQKISNIFVNQWHHCKHYSAKCENSLIADYS